MYQGDESKKGQELYQKGYNDDDSIGKKKERKRKENEEKRSRAVPPVCSSLEQVPTEYHFSGHEFRSDGPIF